MAKKILIGVVVVIGILIAVIATRPAKFRIERSATINAPPEVVYPLIVDFHKWTTWSPWEKMDPKMVRSYEGAGAGVGAVYTWEGNKDVGEGRMTITRAELPKQVDIRLEFLAPFTATNQTVFLLAPVNGRSGAEGTRVTWSMDGVNDFMGKAFSMTMDMDKMVGADFEKGLAAMGVQAEADHAKARADAESAALAAAAAAMPPAEGTAAAATNP